MAYWVKGTMLWYWVGVGLSYTFSIFSIALLLIDRIGNARKKNYEDRNHLHSTNPIIRISIYMVSIIMLGFLGWFTFLFILWLGKTRSLLILLLVIILLIVMKYSKWNTPKSRLIFKYMIILTISLITYSSLAWTTFIIIAWKSGI